ncbi:MAG: outer membrane lipid asymmetry maintenance protein MlaD [Zetaproteobacteria bacterium CG12_big_fil_rev_8_21_14_0_65_55_1124]|nr:MAG: outer membrane lipid asymmetry maintenance protein MlaD [Zetaproteobacteria bacterium CG1_02_55_237]PIS20067.1 MAG: outer membrane lipid asymmetry maintenance protein MlaD [Zetaproteobacteria bacterium CG08_land_8_20_14_0_20_55_17]PIW42100.1 MAG: outer membrane lipid asymmetry maintenance protein MlaD [Zetaproteobacteria bacterium CG12_big_fil_rev_8_21_14_0_65_55_1124]PIY52923.1 MAG: outer membrane lipid asymmetry maintenance protein MlaD [Zetaproteobacteria bacterium CG_4_10_14_0_8_um_f
MSEYKRIEITVGLFVFIGIAGMFYMALKLGEVGGLGADGYHLTAAFGDVGGVRAGADVMIAGVVVGRVDDVHLNERDRAEVSMRIHDDVKITSDAIASIRTKGIIGDRFIRIGQGGGEELSDGGEIEETESAISIEELVSKYIFSSDSSNK